MTMEIGNVTIPTYVLLLIAAYLIYRFSARRPLVEGFDNVQSGNIITLQNKKTSLFLCSCENCPGGAVEFTDTRTQAAQWIITVTTDGNYVLINDKNRQVLTYNDGKLGFTPVHPSALSTGAKFIVTPAPEGYSLISPLSFPHLALTFKEFTDSGEPYFFKILAKEYIADASCWKVDVVRQ
jgi:hypothetical protein